MKCILNASRPRLTAIPSLLQGTVAIGRLLLMLAALSVLTMPLTQNIWTWDHFLRGGQDFETGMLTVVIILCLAVLLTQLYKRQIDLLFTSRRVLASTFNRGESPARSLEGTFFKFYMEPVNGVALERYRRLPLKI